MPLTTDTGSRTCRCNLSPVQSSY